MTCVIKLICFCNATSEFLSVIGMKNMYKESRRVKLHGPKLGSGDQHLNFNIR